MTRSQTRRVAVIGAGISGVVSAAHLLKAGLQVTVFERSAQAGGVWLYDERAAPEPSYTALKPLESEEYFEKDERDVKLRHAPPGPCSTPLMRVKLDSWPEGTPDSVSHSVLRDYIQDTAVKSGVDGITTYAARVKNVEKVDEMWEVTWSTLENGGADSRCQLDYADFVVAGVEEMRFGFVGGVAPVCEGEGRGWGVRL